MNDGAEDALPTHAGVGICADGRRAGRQRNNTVHLPSGKETPGLVYGDRRRIVCDAASIQVPAVFVNDVVEVARGRGGSPKCRDQGSVAGARVARVVVARIRIVAPDKRLCWHY